jgi:hypothetical protein
MEMKDLFLLCSTGRRSLPEIPAVLEYFREFHSEAENALVDREKVVAGTMKGYVSGAIRFLQCLLTELIRRPFPK